MSLIEPVVEVADAIVAELSGPGGVISGPPALLPPVAPANTVGQWDAAFHRVWGDIFGKANARPPRPAINQTQVNQLVAQMLGVLQAEVAAVEQLAEQLVSINGLTTNNLISTINTYTQQQIGQLGASITNLAGQIGAVAAGAGVNAVAIANAHSDALASLEAAARIAAIHDTNLRIKALAQVDAANLASSLAAERATAHAEAEWAAKIANDWGAYAVARADAQASSLTQQMAAETNTLHGEITNGVSQAESFAAGAASAAGAAAVAQTLTQVQPQLDAIKTETDQCLEPLCDTVTPNASQLGRLGNLLKLLEGLGLAGLLAALVGQAAVDPEGAANEVVGGFGWVSDLSVELVNAVLG